MIAFGSPTAETSASIRMVHKVLFAMPDAVLCCQVGDGTGELTALFYGRRHIAGIQPGCRIRLHGMVGTGDDGRPAMINPGYELLR